MKTLAAERKQWPSFDYCREEPILRTAVFENLLIVIYSISRCIVQQMYE
jgi:hypothetical protein